MKRGYVVAMCVALALSLSGCKKKAAQESTDAINLDTLETTTIAPLDANAPAASVSLDATTPQGMLSEAAPSAAPASTSGAPSGQDIQSALKNAGYYSGAVDGKIGPKSKAAIKEFQTANGLTADGKVGAKTWVKLSTYLSSSAAAASTTALSMPSETAAPIATVTKSASVKKTKRGVDQPPSAE